MATHRHPPVIPEIAKAYQNDPQTQMALAALKSGTSTAPVARGGYGYGDGIARVAQALIGAKMEQRASDKYGTDEDKLLALRQARGQDGLNGSSAPPPVPMPSAPPGVRNDDYGAAAGNASQPDNYAAIAAATGAPPPPPQAPQGTAGLPMAPVPTPAAPAPLPAAAMADPTQGAGPGGRPPFGPSPVGGNVPAYLHAPVAEAVPDAPAPVARPTAPEAVGPTKSRMLNAAYRIMAAANPYESASGQDMYQSGLTEQDKFNEAAAERSQKLSDMGYQADLKNYGDAQYQDRAGEIAGRQDVIKRNAEAIAKYGQNVFDYGVHKDDQKFQAGEKAKDRANAVQIERMKEDADAKGSGTDLTPDEETALTLAARQGRVDITRMTKYNRKLMAQTFLSDPKFDAVTNHGMAALAANAPALQKAMMASSLPQVLSNVRDAGKKINLSDAQFLGKMQAWGKGQVNDPDFIGYMNNRNDAMMMIAQVMRGTGATDKAVQLENDAAPKSMSPRAWDAWYTAQMRSLAPRVKIMEQRKLLPTGSSEALTSMSDGMGATAPGGGGKKTGNPLVDKYL